MKGLAYTYYRAKYILKIEKKNILYACIFTLILFMFFIAIATKAYSDYIQTGIASKVVRFHVLANSDTEYDQNLKLAVRDAILKDLGQQLENYRTKEQTKSFLKNNFNRIKQKVGRRIGNMGKFKQLETDYPIPELLQRDIDALQEGVENNVL